MSMPRYRKRIVRKTMGKEARTMSRTLLDDNTANTGSIITVVEASAVASTTGTVDVFKTSDTQKIVGPSAVIKYINIRLESGIRDVAPMAPGFVEYALVIFDEQDAVPTFDSGISSALGTNTLGELCKNRYRGNCIWEGAFALSREIPAVLDLKVKLPKFCCSQKRGRYIMLLKAFRTNDVSDSTSDCRTWYSHNYKCYT